MKKQTLLKLIKKDLTVVYVAVALGIISSLGYFVVDRPKYTATATVYVTFDFAKFAANNSNPVGLYSTASQLSLQKTLAYLPMFNDSSTAIAIKEQLNLPDSVESIAHRINARSIKNTAAIAVTATDNSKEAAQKLADATATVVSGQVRQLEGAGSPLALKLITSATVAPVAKTPSFKMILLFGGVMALLAAALAGAIRYRQLQKRITIGNLYQALDSQLPVLNVISKSIAEGGVECDPVYAEEISAVWSELELSRIDSRLRSVLITSIKRGDGKSTMAASLGKQLAEDGKDVVIIDADFVTMDVTESLASEEYNVGLIDVLKGNVAPFDAIMRTEIEGLNLLAAGQSVNTAAALLSSKRFESVIAALAEKYIVIIDAPEVSAFHDSNITLPSVDGTIVLMSIETVTATELRKYTTKEFIDRISAAGLVVNNLGKNELEAWKLNR